MHWPLVRSPRFTRSVLLALTGFLACLTARAETPVYAKLLGRIDALRVVDGSPFFVKTLTAWKGQGCTLEAGTTLEGEVVHAQHHGHGIKNEELGLRFHPLYCAGNETQPFVPLLVAIEAPHLERGADELAQAELANSFAAMIASHTPMGLSGAGASFGKTGSQSSSFSGAMKDLSNLNVAAPGSEPLRLTEVRGFSRVSLNLPHLLTDPTSLISSHPLLLDRDARMALLLRPIPSEAIAVSRSSPGSVPAKTEVAGTGTVSGTGSLTLHSDPAVAATSGESESKPAPPAVANEPEVDLCVETGCTLAGSDDITDTKLDRTIPLRTLGYSERRNQILRSLADDAAVAFLGNDQVLVTFSVHPLIRRSQAEADRSIGPRTIHALVVSAATAKLLREQEWRIPDRSPYLWPLGKGQVLAHVGNTLTIYGKNLAVEHQWIPPGTVHRVLISPSRELIVVAVERERHTPEQHRQLAEFLGPDRAVEEDENLIVLDGTLKVLGSNRIDGDPALPAVLDTGLVLSDAGAGQKWMVRQFTWSHQKQPIVHVSSSCPLRVETLPENLILLAGCTASTYWYKVVRVDGKILLTGTTPNLRWVEAADAPPGGKVFAIAIATASRPIDFVVGMIASDFQNVTVSVYHNKDGQRIYATRSSHGAVNQHCFALNDVGDRLAILSGDELSLYRIPNQLKDEAMPEVSVRASR